MKKRGVVLFDLYGTLIDIETDEGDPAVFAALSRYLLYHQVKIGPEDLKAAFFGEVGLRLSSREERNPEVNVFEVFRDIMRRHSGKKHHKLVVLSATALFRSLTMRRFGLFPGVRGTLEEIAKTWRTALVSDAQWAFAEPEMEMLGLEKFFLTRVLSSRLGFKKPDPRPFEIAMKRVGVSAGDCVYIGDSPERDLLGATNAGIRCVLFRRAAGPYDGLVAGLSAEASFYEYGELYPLLLRLLPV
ncbi:MAG: HAD family hydrolase [Nitrospiraceae bacterium]|nr:HAD family hydrolase [Nitrospiraceae bacterium]